MNYFLDTEFFEGDKYYRIAGKKVPGIKPVHTVQLISIAIVAENGEHFSGVNKEFCVEDVWESKDTFVRNKVLEPMFRRWTQGAEIFSLSRFKYWLNLMGFTQEELAGNIVAWIAKQENVMCQMKCEAFAPPIYREARPYAIFNPTVIDGQLVKIEYNTNIAFYAYYADYDWVVFCRLFGKMMDLPKGFPMYCIDLKQTLDEKATKLRRSMLRELYPEIAKDALPTQEELRNMTNDQRLEYIKKSTFYPINKQEHDPLFDAVWNKDLYSLLQEL